MSRRRDRLPGSTRQLRQVFACVGVPAHLRAVIYARFSDTDQNPLSIERQIKVASAQIKALGLVLCAIYVDEGKTGKTAAGRAAYELFVQDARRGEFGAAFIESVSRAHRTQSSAHLLFEEFDHLGIKLHDSKHQLDDDRMAEEAKAARRFIREQLKLCQEGRDVAVENGRIPGRNSFGYALDAHNPGLHKIHPEWSLVVLDIFKRLAKGQSTKEVADELNSRGVPTPESCRRISAGKTVAIPAPTWDYNKVRPIATNPIYKGEVITKRTKVVPKSFQSSETCTIRRPEEDWLRSTNARFRIVPVELWDQVNKVLLRRGFNIASRAPNSCLLTGLIFCHACQCQMRARKDSLDRTIYQCISVDETRRRACPGAQGGVLVAQIEDAVLVQMQAALLTPERLAYFVAEYSRRAASLDELRGTRHDDAKKELAALEEQLFATTDARKMEGLEHEDLIAIRSRLKNRIREQRDAVSAILSADCNWTSVKDNVNSLESLNASMALLRSRLPFRPIDDAELGLAYAIRDLVHSVVVDRSTVEGQTLLRIAFRDPLAAILVVEDPSRVMACKPAPVEVILDVAGLAIADAAARKREAIETTNRLALGRRHDISDQAWQVAKVLIDAAKLPDFGSDVRSLLDGIVFALKTGTAFAGVPDRYGTRAGLAKFRGQITYHWIWDDIVEAWQSKCPDVVAGCELSRLAPTRIQKSPKRKVTTAPPTANQLRALAAKEVDQRKRHHMLAVAMVLDKVSSSEAGATIGFNPKRMQGLMFRYRAVGQLAFEDRGKRLTNEQAAELVKILRSGIDPDDSQKRMTIKKLLIVCEHRFGVRYKSYKSLHSRLVSSGALQTGRNGSKSRVA